MPNFTGIMNDLRKGKALRLSFFLILVLPAYAPAAPPLSLVDCIVYALENSPALTVVHYELHEQNQHQMWARKSWLPSLEAYTDYHYYPADLPVWFFPDPEGSILSGGSSEGPYPVGIGLPQNVMAGFRLDQTIFNGRLLISGRLSEAMDRNHSARLKKVREEVVVSVATQYMQLGSSIDRFEIIDFNIQRIERIASALQLQVQEGLARESDFLRLMVRLSVLQADRKKLESAISKQYDYLKLSMGMPVEDDLEIDSSMELFEHVSSDESGDLPVSPSPDELVMRSQKDLLDLGQKLGRREILPSMTAFADLRFNAQRQEFDFFQSGDWYQMHILGIRLSVPLSKVWHGDKDLALASIRSERLDYGIRQQRQKAALEYAAARRELTASHAFMESQERNLQLARRLLAESELKYMEGDLPLIELLEAEALEREAQVAFYDATVAMNLTRLQWYRVTGHLYEAFALKN